MRTLVIARTSLKDYLLRGPLLTAEAAIAKAEQR
jgi:hypothetical protein